MTNILNRESLITRFDEMIDALPDFAKSHLDNLRDDFNDSTSDYLAAIPRFKSNLDYARANDNIIAFYANYDAEIAAAELTDIDLAFIIYAALAEHDCAADCDFD